MEAWCPQMLQAFDNDGDQYSTQHHNNTKHDFPVMPSDDMWPVDAEGKLIDASPDHIYKFTNMKWKWAWNGHKWACNWHPWELACLNTAEHLCI